MHSYPHCWRCATPLIYKPVSSWFVSVTKIKDRLLELNQQINWIPGNVKDGQFGKWLANARDWSISRNRFWGSPIPVWVSDDPKYPRVDVYGSLDELKADFGDYPRDHEGNVNMHRPYIDELTRVNPDDPTGKSHMHRITDVMDCWFESGSMSFAQYHYPFENKETFEQHFPCDYIVEYIGQTRGWFYVLHIMATALFDKPAFKNVICHGIVLGSDGQKMSKHLRNYPDVNGVFNDFGSDAMRWFLMSSPILRGGNLIVTADGIRDTVRQVMLPVWSSYYFFTLYANAANNGAGFDARALRADEVAALPEMDRYLLARTRRLIEKTQSSLDDFLISDACEAVSDFIDMLTNWYIRNNRDRFWNEDANAFNTLYTVLEAFMRVIAPLAPMEAEAVWRGLTGGESVHLADWPFLADEQTGEATELGRVLVDDPAVVDAMEKVREVVSVPLAVKLGAGFTNPLRIVRGLYARGIQGVVLFNRFYPADIDIDRLTVRAGNLYSHRSELSGALRWAALVSGSEPGIDVAVSTGVHQGEDVVKAMLAGASAVEIASAVYERGLGVIAEMNRFVGSWMERHAFLAARDFVGRMNARNIPDPELYERTQFMKYYSCHE